MLVQNLEIVNDLGATLQTALGFNKQVKKAMAVVSKLSVHVNKLSLKKAMLVLQTKVKPIITYALHIHAPYLALDSLQKLDRVKSTYLKKVLDLPRCALTERAHNLCGEKRLCEDLAGKNYKFEKSVWRQYSQHLELQRRTTPECNNIGNNIAFDEDRWKGPGQARHHVAIDVCKGLGDKPLYTKYLELVKSYKQ